MRIVVSTVLYASGGSPIASTTSATLDSPRSQRTSMRRYSASVRVGDFLRGMCRGYHPAAAVSTKVLRRSDENADPARASRTATARAAAVQFGSWAEWKLELLRGVAFARADLLGVDDLLGCRAVRIGTLLCRVVAADRRRDHEVLAGARALVARDDLAGVGLLDRLMVALAEIGAALLIRVVVIALERGDELLGIGRSGMLDAVHEIAPGLVAEVLAPIDCTHAGFERVVHALRVAARFRAPDVAPDRTDEIVDRHADRDV